MGQMEGYLLSLVSLQFSVLLWGLGVIWAQPRGKPAIGVFGFAAIAMGSFNAIALHQTIHWSISVSILILSIVVLVRGVRLAKSRGMFGYRALGYAAETMVFAFVGFMVGFFYLFVTGWMSGKFGN